MKVFILESKEASRTRLIYLVQEKYPGAEILGATSAQNAYLTLKDNKAFDLLLLSYDLGLLPSGGKETGLNVAKYIKKNKIEYKKCILHDPDFNGSRAMRKSLDAEKTAAININLLTSQYI
jgi:DNA-binding LytR/AlgR family response regulator